MKPFRLRRWAPALILAAGLAASAAIYCAAPAQDPDDDTLLDDRRNLRQLEEIGGKASVLGVDILEKFQRLWHGRRLAVTVAVLSGASSWLVWLVSTRWDESADSLNAPYSRRRPPGSPP